MLMHSKKEDIAVGMIAGVAVGTIIGAAVKAACDCGHKTRTQKLMCDVKRSTSKLLGCLK